jgi:hypothetical protein
VEIPADISAGVIKAGERLPNMRVHLFTHSGNYAGVRSVTGAEGEPAVFGVPHANETYKVRTRVDGVTHWSEPVSPGGEITIRIGSDIRVGVKKAGEPLADHRVHLFYADGNYARVAKRTGPGGESALLPVPDPARRYRVRTRSGGLSYWSEVLDPGAEATISVRADITAVVRRGGEDLCDQPVHLFHADGSYAGVGGRSGPAGEAAVLAVPEGGATFKVRTRVEGVTYWTDELSPGDCVTIEIPAPIRVSVNKGGENLPGQRVHLFYAGGSYAGVGSRTGTDGAAARLALPDPNADYRIRTRIGGVTYWSENATAGAELTLHIPGDISAAVEKEGHSLPDQPMHLFYVTEATPVCRARPEARARPHPSPSPTAIGPIRSEPGWGV